jgi:ElaB/YqjD/DUF883 family membrane-anchored ribosome-binding protein
MQVVPTSILRVALYMKIVNDCYHSISELQKKQFDNMLNGIEQAADKLVKSIDKATANCNQSAKRAEESCDRVFNAQGWQSVIFLAAPIAVLLNLIIIVAQIIF